MKKLIFSLLATSMLLLTAPAQGAEDEKSKKDVVTEEISAAAIAEAKADINLKVERLVEIKKMEIGSLSKIERKELRKEVRSIRRALKTYSKSDSEAVAEAAAAGADGAGIYISGGALIVILLLLLLL